MLKFVAQENFVILPSVQNALKAIAECILSYSILDLRRFLSEPGNSVEAYIQEEIKNTVRKIKLNEEELAFLTKALHEYIFEVLTTGSLACLKHSYRIIDFLEDRSVYVLPVRVDDYSYSV